MCSTSSVHTEHTYHWLYCLMPLLENSRYIESIHYPCDMWMNTCYAKPTTFDMCILIFDIFFPFPFHLFSLIFSYYLFLFLCLLSDRHLLVCAILDLICSLLLWIAAILSICYLSLCSCSSLAISVHLLWKVVIIHNVSFWTNHEGWEW